MLIVSRRHARYLPAIVQSGGLLRRTGHLRRLLAMSLGMCLGAHAAERSPLDSQERVPAVRYQSAFDGYRRLQDTQPGDWRAANETVGRIGGWRVYAREAEPPGAPATPAEGHHHPPQGKPTVRLP